MVTIKKNHLVKKRNILNEIRANGMTLQELRFFSIYLSKINPNDVSTRVVRFTIDDFKNIMDLGRINVEYMKQVTNRLLCKVVNVPNDRGGYTGFQLFKECTLDTSDGTEWYIEIDAHDKALPLMFEFKEKYFTYQLWNALCLKSSNQLRMYEILKQYEKIGTRILPIDDLRNLLGISSTEYTRYDNFKNRVLAPCQKVLSENTDIKFTYEPYGKKRKGGKILFLKFIIEKNADYVDQLTLDRFIEYNKISSHEEDASEPSVYDERMNFLSDACDNEFSIGEIIVLYNLMIGNLPYEKIRNEIECYNYLKHKYDEMNMRSEKSSIKHRFSYLKKIISAD